jgi:hypothetical protein
MKKCLRCSIVLDLPCPNPLCTGQHSESMGELCRYCATNQRDAPLPPDEGLDLFVSSLGDLEEPVQDINEYAPDAERHCRRSWWEKEPREAPVDTA